MADGTCSVPDCSHPAHSRSWCRTHYNRWHKFGDVQADKPVNVRKAPPQPGESCEVSGCERPMRYRPWCEPHHKRWLTAGDVDADRPVKNRGGPMGTVPCSVEGCRNPSRTRGWCHGHYRRWRKTGSAMESVELQPAGLPPEDRFWPKIDKNGPVPAIQRRLGRCHLWTGPVNSTGYGVINVDGTYLGAHHAGWLFSGGAPFLPGFVLDHLCGVRRCVRKSHLEPIPQSVNMQRAAEAARAAVGRSALECIKGHAKTPGKAKCGQCARESQARLNREFTLPRAERGPRLKMTDDLARQVAEVFQTAVANGEPPLVALSKHFRRSYSQAGHLAKFARQRGFMPSGIAGGRNRRAKPRFEPSDVVYLVERQGFVKIGYTSNLNNRLAALPKETIRVEGMTPGPVQLLTVIPGDRSLERQMHRRFADLRAGGEWFRLEGSLLVFLEQQAATTPVAA